MAILRYEIDLLKSQSAHSARIETIMSTLCVKIKKTSQSSHSARIETAILHKNSDRFIFNSHDITQLHMQYLSAYRKRTAFKLDHMSTFLV